MQGDSIQARSVSVMDNSQWEYRRGFTKLLAGQRVCVCLVPPNRVALSFVAFCVVGWAPSYSGGRDATFEPVVFAFEDEVAGVFEEAVDGGIGEDGVGETHPLDTESSTWDRSARPPSRGHDLDAMGPTAQFLAGSPDAGLDPVCEDVQRIGVPAGTIALMVMTIIHQARITVAS